MESLLANYGSDDEEDEGPQQKPRARAPLFASLPPKLTDGPPSEIPARESSLFASLPRPKLASEGSNFRVSEDRIGNPSEELKAPETPFVATRRDAGNALMHRETEGNSRLRGVSDDRVADMAAMVSDGVQRVAGKDAKLLTDGAKSDAVPFSQGSRRVSLFGALPPPKSSGSSGGILKSQPLSGAGSKRIIELRPVINVALLQDLDDDDIQPRAKRHATVGMSSGKATGLAAILPKPKNLGSTLGSGYASGHHATLDVGASVNSVPSRSESISSESAPQLMHDSSSFLHEHTPEAQDNNEHFHGSHVSTSSAEWEGYSHAEGADSQNHTDAVQLSAPSSASYHSSIASQESAEVLNSGDHYRVLDDYSEGMIAHETPSTTMSGAHDSLANMLMKERRKGGKNAPLNIIEVKQADLTATKLREDQLRTTGIAFGPAYRPVSSNKNKPSKLHRRKHQIGSLYYDMKQKEMELLERRSKGNMTKAETQAKYGW